MDARMTQNKAVVEYMTVHGSITSMEAFANLGITRLSGRILELRRKGYNIITERSGGEKNYAIYKFGEEIENVG